MIEQRMALRQQRDLSEIIETTASIYTRNFPAFFRIAAIAIPLGIATAIFQASIDNDVVALAVVGVLTVLQAAVNLLAAAAIIAALRELDDGRPADFSQAYDVAFARFWTLAGALLRATFHVVLFAITIIGIPWAIQRMVRWLFVEQAVILDGADWKAALSTSANAVIGSWWRTLGIWVVISVITLVPTGLTSALFLLAPILVSGTVNAVLGAALLPFTIIGMTLLYCDLQVRKRDAMAQEASQLDSITARKELGMTTSGILIDTPLPNPAHRGKVRDLYDLGDRLLIVATDRVSAFDVVLPSGIPGKGAVLTQLSAFWFQRTVDVVPNHYLRLADGSPADELPFALPPELIGRSMIVRKAQRLPVECIVRGYMAGSAWAEYQKGGTVCGVRLPPGIQESEQFPEPLFTPTTKADVGHDENLSADQYVELLGMEVANAVRLRSLALYRYGAELARERGIIIADTKFEFGLLDGEPILIDELLTPDSSRFWDAGGHAAGKHMEAWDKQYLRDWLLASDWNLAPPAPELPPDVVAETARRYREIYKRLTGEEVRL